MDFKLGLSFSLFGGSGYDYGYKKPQTPVVMNVLPSQPHCSCRDCSRGQRKTTTTTTKKRMTTKEEKQSRVYQYNHGVRNYGGGVPQQKHSYASYSHRQAEVYAGRNAAAGSGYGAAAAYRKYKHEVYESEEEEEEEEEEESEEESDNEDDDSEDDDSDEEERTVHHLQPCKAMGRPQEHVQRYRKY